MSFAKIERQERKHAHYVWVAFRSNSGRRLRAAVRDYLNSYASRYIAANEAVRTCKRRTHKSVEQITTEMNVWRPCDERVNVNVAMKETPSFPSQCEYDIRARVTLAFGPENQARQILIRNLLKAMWYTSSCQTMHNGGRTRAVHLVKEYYAKGYQFIQEVDIYRCFPSFDNKGIGKFLCLPEKVTEHVLGASSLNLNPSITCRREVIYHSPDFSLSPMELLYERFGEDWDPAQLGLIEGSKVSSFAAELLLAPVCDDLAVSGLGRVVNYADNFLLMAKTKRGLTKLIKILREGLHTHPAGPLKVKDFPTHVAPQNEFEFLGYKFLPNGKRLSCTWGKRAETKARKLRREGHRLLTSSMPQDRKASEFERIQKKHCSIVGAFPEWPDRMNYHHSKMRALADHIGENDHSG